jgi:5-methylcytosine-specific restriction enzyme subunit McrC
MSTLRSSPTRQAYTNTTTPANIQFLVNIYLEENKTKLVVLEEDVTKALRKSGIVDVQPDPSVTGGCLLTADGKAGTARVRTAAGHEVTVHIKPKVPVARLLFLIGYVLNPHGWRDEEVPVGTEFDLVAVMAVLFQRHTAKALRRSRIRVSSAVNETAVVMRGKLRPAQQVRRRQNRAVPVEITTGKPTIDLPENRLLLTACERLLAMSEAIPEKIRAGLRTIHRQLQGATPILPHQALPAWQPAPRNNGFHEALRLAELILQNRSVERVAASTEPIMVHGFIFQMSTVFQDFVTVALREALGRHGCRCDIAPRGNFLADHDLAEIKPDLIGYGTGDTPILIVDAKYKAENLPAADVYQMLAYCVGLDLKEGHLVHPAGAPSPGSYTIPNAHTRVYYHAIDLDQPREALLEDIATLAEGLLTARAGPVL